MADRYGLTEKLTEYAKTLPGKVGGGALGVIAGIFSALLNVLLVTVLTIYFMADLPRVRRGIVRLVPRQGRPRAAQAINVVVDKVGGYMIGNLIISLFAGVSSFVCLFADGRAVRAARSRSSSRSPTSSRSSAPPSAPSAARSSRW